ncbi:MAG: hypothetical protein R8P61_03190 [Bacteroidia bacterium]|nr:hypothetical protein [Bacteroidia bacterium]
MEKEIKLELFADYFQFYLQDEETAEEIEDAWNKADLDRKLVVDKDQVIIGTARNMTVQVLLKIYYDPPPMSINSQHSIDKINECDIETASGNLVIAGCTDYYPEARRIRLEKDIYRLRIYYYNLSKLSEDGLEGEDFYEIHLWRTNKASGLKIIK